MVTAFSQDISASLSLPCALVIYLHLWNVLEGGLRGAEAPLTDICHIRGDYSSRINLPGHLRVLLLVTRVPYDSSPRTYCWWNVVPKPITWAQVLLPHNIYIYIYIYMNMQYDNLTTILICNRIINIQKKKSNYIKLCNVYSKSIKPMRHYNFFSTLNWGIYF